MAYKNWEKEVDAFYKRFEANINANKYATINEMFDRDLKQKLILIDRQYEKFHRNTSNAWANSDYAWTRG